MMIQLRKLSDSEFQATFESPMRNVTASAPALVDIWPYANTVLSEEFRDHESDDWDVQHVYENSSCTYHHVLINTDVANAFLVIVIEVDSKSIFGHHFLNLNTKYDLGN
jgi:hypothetical protein